jgi:hypothetical protein
MLPKIYDQIVILRLSLGSTAARYGDPWALGEELKEIREKYKARLREEDVFRHLGQRVAWTTDSLDDPIVITEGALYGAIRNAGLPALLKYLAFREQNGWVGPSSSFPSQDRRSFRAVEVGLLEFRAASFLPPYAEIEIDNLADGDAKPLVQSLYQAEADDCPKCELDPDDWTVARFDLNEDGSPELFVKYGYPYCGTIGCTTKVFEKSEKGWREIVEYPSDYHVWIMAERANGYHGFYSAEYVVKWGRYGDYVGYVGECESWKCFNELGDYWSE